MCLRFSQLRISLSSRGWRPKFKSLIDWLISFGHFYDWFVEAGNLSVGYKINHQLVRLLWLPNHWFSVGIISAAPASKFPSQEWSGESSEPGGWRRTAARARLGLQLYRGWWLLAGRKLHSITFIPFNFVMKHKWKWRGCLFLTGNAFILCVTFFVAKSDLSLGEFPC